MFIVMLFVLNDQVSVFNLFFGDNKVQVKVENVHFSYKLLIYLTSYTLAVTCCLSVTI